MSASFNVTSSQPSQLCLFYFEIEIINWRSKTIQKRFCYVLCCIIEGSITWIDLIRLRWQLLKQIKRMRLNCVPSCPAGTLQAFCLARVEHGLLADWRGKSTLLQRGRVEERLRDHLWCSTAGAAKTEVLQSIVRCLGKPQVSKTGTSVPFCSVPQLPHLLSPKTFSLPPKETEQLLSNHFLFLPLCYMIITNMFPASIGLLVIDISFKWNHILYNFLCLNFSQHIF